MMRPYDGQDAVLCGRAKDIDTETEMIQNTWNREDNLSDQISSWNRCPIHAKASSPDGREIVVALKKNQIIRCYKLSELSLSSLLEPGQQQNAVTTKKTLQSTCCLIS